MYHDTLSIYHGTLIMYHGTLSIYHGTLSMYHGIFSYGKSLENPEGMFSVPKSMVGGLLTNDRMEVFIIISRRKIINSVKIHFNIFAKTLHF